MKEKIINDVCLMIGKAYADIDLSTVRNILTLALKDCEITKRSTDVTVYEGNEDEELIQAFLVAKRVAGSSNKTIKHMTLGTDRANTLLKAERMNYHDKTY